MYTCIYLQPIQTILSLMFSDSLIFSAQYPRVVNIATTVKDQFLPRLRFLVRLFVGRQEDNKLEGCREMLTGINLPLICHSCCLALSCYKLLIPITQLLLFLFVCLCLRFVCLCLRFVCCDCEFKLWCDKCLISGVERRQFRIVAFAIKLSTSETFSSKSQNESTLNVIFLFYPTYPSM